MIILDQVGYYLWLLLARNFTSCVIFLTVIGIGDVMHKQVVILSTQGLNSYLTVNVIALNRAR